VPLQDLQPLSLSLHCLHLLKQCRLPQPLLQLLLLGVSQRPRPQPLLCRTACSHRDRDQTHHSLVQLPLQLTLCASLLLLHMLQPIETLLAAQQNQSQMPHLHLLLHLHLHIQLLPQMLMGLCPHFYSYALRLHMLLWVVTQAWK